MIDQFNWTKATRATFGKVHVFADFNKKKSCLSTLFITRMITDWIGLHSILLPLLTATFMVSAVVSTRTANDTQLYLNTELSLVPKEQILISLGFLRILYEAWGSKSQTRQKEPPLYHPLPFHNDNHHNSIARSHHFQRSWTKICLYQRWKSLQVKMQCERQSLFDSLFTRRILINLSDDLQWYLLPSTRPVYAISITNIIEVDMNEIYTKSLLIAQGRGFWGKGRTWFSVWMWEYGMGNHVWGISKFQCNN